MSTPTIPTGNHPNQHREPRPKLWIATFGWDHVHPITDEPLRDCFTRVPGDTYADAHGLMAMSVFGRQWAFLYEHEDTTDPLDSRVLIGHAAGVRRYGLREVPFVEPSTVAASLWQTHRDHVDQLGINPDWWADRVVQPAEIAHHKAIAARADVVDRALRWAADMAELEAVAPGTARSDASRELLAAVDRLTDAHLARVAPALTNGGPS